MTILSQAQTIRDETVANANTATRVGTCLVDIANELIAIDPSLSKPYCFASAIDNAAATTIGAAGVYVKAVVDNAANNNSFGWSVSAGGVITNTTTDSVTRNYLITATASVYVDSGQHILHFRIGNTSTSFASTTVASTFSNGLNKQNQITLSGIFSATVDDSFQLWMTEEHGTELPVVTHLTITAIYVGDATPG